MKKKYKKKVGSYYKTSQSQHVRLMNKYASGSSNKDKALAEYHEDIYIHQLAEHKVLSKKERSEILCMFLNKHHINKI